MLKALLWREFREQRRLVLAAWGIALLLPLVVIASLLATASGELRGLEGVVPMVVVFGVWPVIAAAIGAVTVSADRGDESLRFLLSRPVSRRRVWAVKVLVAVGALVLAVAGSLGIALVADYLIVGRAGVVWDQPATVMVAAVPVVLLFASAHYCSLFLRRPLAAALAGAVVAGSIAACLNAAWLLLAAGAGGFRDGGFITSLGVGFPLAIAGLLVAGYRMFRRDELATGRVARRMAAPLVVVTAAAFVVSAAPATYAGLRGLAERAVRHSGDLRVVDDRFVVPQRNPSGLSTAVAAHSLAGDEPRVLVPANATLPALSPNGEWVVYVAVEGLLRGTRESRLRAVRIDGSEDRVISGPLPHWRPGSYPGMVGIAPDSDRVVFAGYGDAIVTSITGGPAGERHVGLLDSSGTFRREGSVLGWVAAGPEASGATELLYYRTLGRYGRVPRDAAGVADAERDDRLPRTELRALNTDDGTERIVAAFAGVHDLSAAVWRSRYGAGALRDWEWLPVWMGDDRDEPRLLLLVHAVSGGVVEITRTPCGYWGITDARDRFIYGDCGGSLRTGDARTELRIRDLASGAEQRFAEIENIEGTSFAREMMISPGGQQLLIYGRRGFGSEWATHVVHRDGDIRLVAAGYAPLLWRDDHEALLVRAFDELALLIADVESGATRMVFP